MAGLTVSALGFGCMRFPLTDENEPKTIDFGKTEAMIDEAYRAGVNYFDTAYVYHGERSEEVTGKILAKYPRESFYVADKFPQWMLKTEDDVARIFEEQLERLGMEYIDFYLLHALEAGALDRVRQNRLYELMLREKERGRIKRLGFSFHDKPDVLQTIVDEHDYDFAQIQLNYYDWTHQDAKRQLEILESKNIPVVVMEPVRGGFLAAPTEEGTKYIAERLPDTPPARLALRWASQFESVKVVLSGMTAMEQVNENIAAFSGMPPFTQKEREVCESVVEIVKRTNVVPCTSCKYCLDDCPKKIDIPKFLGLYNFYSIFRDNWNTSVQYAAIPKDKHPSLCVKCGKCAAHCPQHIEIPKVLEEADAHIKKSALNMG
jgi:predicted aldo/keto reductase-like oxidoreductase